MGGQEPTFQSTKLHSLAGRASTTLDTCRHGGHTAATLWCMPGCQAAWQPPVQVDQQAGQRSDAPIISHDQSLHSPDAALHS